MGKRELATVSNVFYGKEDHGILTCYVTLDFNGYTQSFGGITLNDEKGEEFKKELRNLFGVDDYRKIVGRKCYGLYAFGYHNDRIEGLENEYGHRFILTKFCQKHWPNANIKSRLESEKERHKHEIAHHQRRIQQERESLKNLKNQYTDWSK